MGMASLKRVWFAYKSGQAKSLTVCYSLVATEKARVFQWQCQLSWLFQNKIEVSLIVQTVFVEKKSFSSAALFLCRLVAITRPVGSTVARNQAPDSTWDAWPLGL